MSFLAQRFAVSRRLVDRIDLRFQRFAMERIDWRHRLVMITGMRGVGKTTLLLQRLKRAHADEPERGLYVTADDVNLGDVRLVDLAERFALDHAGKTLVIDEVHRYPNWARELKNIHDLLPDLHVVVTGSSHLDLERGQHELARRVLTVRLPHLSFREYLELELGVSIEPMALEALLDAHATLTQRVVSALRDRDDTVLSRFSAYLERGAYPYGQGTRTADLHAQIMSALQAVLYQDIPATFGSGSTAAATMQRLIALVTTTEPFVPNVESMARTLGIAKTTAYAYLDQLERSSVLTFLPQARSGAAAVRKPAKIYLATPTLYAAVAGVKGLQLRRGTLREAFFVSQVASEYPITAHGSADVEIGGASPLVVEIGGPGKRDAQLPSDARGVLALDGVEHGLGRTVPLWAFGFLY
ncbi:MAG: ATP-binding protein [Trueperaceae bacterium]|nr:MAG: ATP-binding protein [Trueperaceae bacterium]